MSSQGKLKILFLCTGNSCRSQMAEGWARALKSDALEAYSAGIETHGLNPDAVRVMAEAGVDISSHCSKNVAALMHVPFDFVVTVCGNAHETCPLFPGKARIIHVGFDDPPKPAQGTTTEEARLAPYRRVRDEIRQFILSLPDSLATDQSENIRALKNTQNPLAKKLEPLLPKGTDLGDTITSVDIKATKPQKAP
jgi:arsenate reductase (thioredoxin)